MTSCDPQSPSRRLLLVLALSGVVHCRGGEVAAQARKKQSSASGRAESQRAPSGGALPPGVAEMREAILAAVRSGDIEDLRHAIELNELKPELGAAAGSDPIAHLKAISGDGEGREILAALGEVLGMAPATLPVGRDLENNLLYVWPYLAELKPADLTPAQQVDLLRLVTPAEAKAMQAGGKWLWWRLAIGADGTWHMFAKAK